MGTIDVTWQPDAETLAEGYRVYRVTPAAKRSQRFRLGIVGVFFLVILIFAWTSGSSIGVFIVLVFAVFVIRRAFTGGANDRRWAEAFMKDPNSRQPQRLEVSESSVIFHLGDSVTTWVWSEVVEVHESPRTFTFITNGTSTGTGAAQVNSRINSVVIMPRTILTGDDETRLREIVRQKNRLISEPPGPVAGPEGPAGPPPAP